MAAVGEGSRIKRGADGDADGFSLSRRRTDELGGYSAHEIIHQEGERGCASPSSLSGRATPVKGSPPQSPLQVSPLTNRKGRASTSSCRPPSAPHRSLKRPERERREENGDTLPVYPDAAGSRFGMGASLFGELFCEAGASMPNIQRHRIRKETLSTESSEDEFIIHRRRREKPEDTSAENSRVRKRNVFEDASKAATLLKIAIDGTSYELEYLGEGSYKTVYTFTNDVRFDGNRCVVKTYNEDRVEYVTLHGFTVWTNHSMEQYNTIAAYNKKIAAEVATEKSAEKIALRYQLPIARIYNNPIEDGYFICEEVSKQWDYESDKALWRDSKVTVESLPKEVHYRLEQYKRFVEWAFNNNVAIDIKPDNFGIRDEILILLDFLEESEDLVAFLNTNLKVFCQGNRSIFQFLIENITDPRARNILEKSFDG